MNARLLFIGLWNFCDDCGRHALSARTIKAEVLPGDDISLEDVLGMLQELSNNNLITTYSVDGKEYLQINGWRHQRIDKPQAPKHPGPSDDHSKNDLGTFPPDRIGGDRKGKEEPPSEGASAPAEASPDKELFDLGKRVLGANAGGLITRLKNHCGMEAAKKHLGDAAGKSDPREWVGAIIRDPDAKEDAEHEAWRQDYFRGVM